jgi:hypothetical protein
MDLILLQNIQQLIALNFVGILTSQAKYFFCRNTLAIGKPFVIEGSVWPPRGCHPAQQ